MEDRRHWVWVTRPEFYLDESGAEREDLAPGNQTPDGWWTCHPNTRAGDLVLLYRTSPKRNFAYLFEAASDGRLYEDDRPDGTLTPAQREELQDAACRRYPDLAEQRAAMTDFERRFEELRNESGGLGNELENMVERFPDIFHVDPDTLPSDARPILLDFIRRERANDENFRSLESEYEDFLGVPPLPDDFEIESDSYWKQIMQHSQQIDEAREKMWEAFWDEVLTRSDLPTDTMVWDPGEFAGAHVCEWKSRVKIADPLPLSAVKAEPRLQEWSAVRGSFQRQVWPADEQWSILVRLIDDRNPGFADTLATFGDRRVSADIANEQALEDALAGPGLSAIDPNLELVRRQNRCAPFLWSIDLLCRDRSEDAYVVIELKVVRASEAVHAQTARYVGWVKENLAAPRQRVRAIIVSDGYDDRFKYAVAANDDFSHIELADVLDRLPSSPVE